MRLPGQIAPVLRPPNFPTVLLADVEQTVSDTTDPNDPGYFAPSYGDRGCHIFSDAAFLRCIAGSRF